MDMHELNSSTFLEIEVKYDVSKLTLPFFKEFMERHYSSHWITVGSDDVYYSKSMDEFIRYRHRPDRGELTIKKKVGGSNFTRTEVNVAATGNSTENIAKFCGELGYTHDFTIYKDCWIIDLGATTVVYYVVYDSKREVELDRFLEIEANDTFCKINDISCAHAVRQVEQSFKGSLLHMDAKPISKSIFELYTNR